MWKKWISYMQIMCRHCGHLVSPVHDEVKQEYRCEFCGRVLLKYREGEANGQSIGGKGG